MTLSHTGPLFTIRDGLRIVASGEIRCSHGIWTLREGWVVPSHRGRGLQRRLIRARLHYARRKGARRVVAWVLARNCYSLNNLVEVGFRFTRRCHRVFDGAKHLNLEYVLTAPICP